VSLALAKRAVARSARRRRRRRRVGGVSHRDNLAPDARALVPRLARFNFAPLQRALDFGEFAGETRALVVEVARRLPHSLQRVIALSQVRVGFAFERSDALFKRLFARSRRRDDLSKSVKPFPAHFERSI
jgi:hypothetical protein